MIYVFVLSGLTRATQPRCNGSLWDLESSRNKDTDYCIWLDNLIGTVIATWHAEALISHG
jgi:hypothetical protein